MIHSKTDAPIIRMLGVNYLPEPLVDRKVKGVTYYGYAPLGTDEGEPGWLIIRCVTANKVTHVEYATPEPEKFVHVWNDRATSFSSSFVRNGYLYNGEFYSDANHTILLPHDAMSVYIDIVSNKGYMWNGTTFVYSVDDDILGIIGDLNDLTTTEKGSIVGAINEVEGEADPNVITVANSVPSQALSPNVPYVFSTRSSALAITLIAGASGKVNEYHFIITIDSTTLPAITLPTITAWSGNCVGSNGLPVFALGNIYEVSILDGLGFINEFAL